MLFPDPIALETMLRAGVDVATKGVALMLVAAAVAFGLRRASAAARHTSWSLALLALLILPFVSTRMPSIALPLPTEWSDSLRLSDFLGDASRNDATVLHAAAEPVDNEAAQVTPPAGETQQLFVQQATTWQPPETPQAGTSVLGSARTEVAKGETLLAVEAAEHGLHPSGTAKGFAGSGPAGVANPAAVAWILRLAWLWLAGALLVAGWFVLQHGSVRWLEQKAHPLRDEDTRRLVRRLAASLGLHRPLRVLEAEETTMPMTWGVWRPVVLLPRGVACWSRDRLRNVLLHELAHVKRADQLTQLLAQLTCVLHWFNPLVWVAARRLHLEREHACDDYVLETGARPSDYAESLLEVARSLRRTPRVSMAAIAMAGRSTLSERLLAVLDEKRARRRDNRTLIGTLAVIGACVVALAAVDVLPDANAAPPTRKEHARHRAPATPEAPPTAQSDVMPAAAPAAPEATVLAQSGIMPAESPVAPEVPPPAQSDVMPAESPAAPEVPPPAQSDVMPAEAPAAPEVPPMPEAAWGGNGYSSRIELDGDFSGSHWDGRIHMNWTDDHRRVQLKSRGEIRFSADMSTVDWISRHGYLDLEEEHDGKETRVRLRGERDGDMSRQWWVDGKETPWDADADRWLAEQLPQILRETGMNAEARVRQILDAKGVDGVLAEIEQIRSDHAQRAYLNELQAQADLKPQELQRVFATAAQTIDSDFELATLLVSIAEHETLEEESAISYAKATQTIGSDFEHKRALLALAKQQTLSPKALEEVLRAASPIGSDFELANLLVVIGESHQLDDASAQEFFAVLQTVGSDFEHRKVLKALAQQPSLPPGVLLGMLRSAERELGSDFEMAEFLIVLGKEQKLEGETMDAYLEALSTVGSDFEYRRAASELVEQGLDDADLVMLVRDAGRQVDSDFELAQLLTQIAKTYDVQGELREAYLAASESIGSEHENRRVLSALVERERSSR